MLKGYKGGGREMVTARLLTNCSNTLRNMHTNARENITRTYAKRKAGYFFVAYFVASPLLADIP
jgi:hypothetical protein